MNVSPPKPDESDLIVGVGTGLSPPFMRPYLDAVDYAVCLNGRDESVGTHWALYRGGERVGEIVAAYDELPYGAGDGTPHWPRWRVE